MQKDFELHNGPTATHNAGGGSPERRLETAFRIALACLVIIGGLSYFGVDRLNAHAAQVAHMHEVLTSLQSLRATSERAEGTERAYVLNPQEADLPIYRQAVQQLWSEFRRLESLCEDNETQQARLKSLQPLLQRQIEGSIAVMDLRSRGDFASAQRQFLTNQATHLDAGIRQIVDDMTTSQRALLSEQEAQTRGSSLFAKTTISGGGVLAVILMALALSAIRRDLIGRQRAEQQLQAANNALEERVAERAAELEHTTESLRLNERRLRAFVSATSDVVYRMSPDWSVMLQLQGQDFIPDTDEASRGWLEKYIPPEDQDQVMAVIRQAIRDKKNFQLEHRIRRVDGNWGWTFSRAIPLLGPQGGVIEWFGAASDVTQRKLAELKLQAQFGRLRLLDQITHAIGEHQDVPNIFQVVMEALEERMAVDFCSISLYNAATKQLTLTYVGPKSAAIAEAAGLDQRPSIDMSTEGQSRFVSGQVLYEPDLQSLALPVPSRLAQVGVRSLAAAPLLAEAKVMGILVMARRQPNSFNSEDCEFLRQLSEHVALATQQARLHEALQKAYDDLRHSQQAVMQQERLLALGKMASGIAHDINNAISPISLYTELLLEHATELTPRSRGQLETIQRAIDDVAQTVARLREFYRTRDAQRKPLAVDLNTLVPQVIQLTRARWSDMTHQRGIVIELRTELAPELPVVLGFEGELRDALTNLIFNAVDAMPQGGQLTVRTRLARNDSQVGHSVRLEVTDTGIGMDDSTRRRCLEPFFTTKGERGTGLGLAMVYGTAQRHGADLQIESEPGQGTTVTLAFDVAPGTSTGSDEAPAASLPPPLRILLVDDDPYVLQSLQQSLQADGHQVTTADGGQAGIDAFRQASLGTQGFQAVITDLGMPYVDGKAVARAVKSVQRETPVVMITGWGLRLLEDGVLPPDVDFVLAKPPRLGQLRDVLNRAAPQSRPAGS